MKKKEFKTRCEFILRAFHSGNITMEEGVDFLVDFMSYRKDTAYETWFIIGVFIGYLIGNVSEILKIFH